jgi:hypothetical protein
MQDFQGVLILSISGVEPGEKEVAFETLGVGFDRLLVLFDGLETKTFSLRDVFGRTSEK